MSDNYLDNTIELMKKAYEINNKTGIEEYKRLEKLQEKRRESKWEKVGKN